MKKKKSVSSTIIAVARVIVIVMLMFLVLFPIVWMFAGAVKPEKEILQYPPTVFGTEFTWKSFQRVFKTIPMAIYLKNTVIFAGLSTLGAILFDSMSGYAFARLQFKGKNVLFIIVLLSMMVPFQVMMIPLFLESSMLGLLNTYVGLILPKLTTAFGIFMMRSYFAALPKELEEAARVDGCSEIGIFFKIMLPLVKPGILTLAIFHLMNNWNDLLYPLMMTSDSKMRTLSAGLALFVGDHASLYYGAQLAGAVIAVLPLLILYIFFQKYFVNSAVSSGIKG